MILKAWLKKHKLLDSAGKEITVQQGSAWLKRVWGNFLRFGNVADAPRAPKHRLLDHDAALRASTLVKQGMWVTTRVGSHMLEHLSYFTSIKQACEHCEELEQIREEHGLTHDQLLTAMHEADPLLVSRNILFKHMLTDVEKEKRSAFAADMLGRFHSDPSFVESIIFIDEASIVISNRTKSDVHAWCDAHDLSFTDVCSIPQHKGKDLTVRWICAVSAHPAFADKGGLVYFEFTTGTTDINRRVNTRIYGNEIKHNHAYQVSMLHIQNLWLPCSSTSTWQLGIISCTASTYSISSPFTMYVSHPYEGVSTML